MPARQLNAAHHQQDETSTAYHSSSDDSITGPSSPTPGPAWLRLRPAFAEDISQPAPTVTSQKRKSEGSDGEVIPSRPTQGRHASKKHKAPSVTKSEDEDDTCEAECIIEVEMPPIIQVVNRKEKLQKQDNKTFGPVDITNIIPWGVFLVRVAQAVQCSVEAMDVSSMHWKWTKPANSARFPISSAAGLQSLQKKLKPNSPAVKILMKPPQKVISKAPVYNLSFSYLFY